MSPRTREAHERVVIEAPDWVNVIATTGDRRVVLVEQYRHGVGQVTLELPGGIIDVGEDPTLAGMRELREETGFGGRTGLLIGRVHPNPAYQTNTHYTVLVRDARSAGELQQDSGEDIAVRLLPLVDIPRLIQRGVITHALNVVAFFWLNAWNDQK